MHTDSIIQLLSNGAMPSARLLAQSGLSQPTLSRLLNGPLRDRVAKIGSARNTQYALKRNVRHFAEFPVYRVDETGVPSYFGALVPLKGDEWQFIDPDGKSGLFEGLPWFIQDMRPQGYIGQLANQIFPFPGCPERVKDWSDDQALLFLSERGDNTIGNLIIGDMALANYMNNVRPPISVAEFPAYAKNHLSMGIGGSSAGGEQPKFAGFVEGFGSAIVKFTANPTDQHALSSRFRDTLICEGLVQKPMRMMGIMTADYELNNVDNMTFLMVRRFDRIDFANNSLGEGPGRAGRRAVFSLDALSNSFIGNKGNFSESARKLFELDMISQETVDEINKIYLFGRLINNTDMHQGNLSFFKLPGKDIRFECAPVYDMLPMGYRPLDNMVPQNTFSVPNVGAVLKYIDEVLPAVYAYWHDVMEHPEVSEEFKQVANTHVNILINTLGKADKEILFTRPKF